MQQIIPLEKLIRNHPRLCLISALICFFVIAPTVVYVANREWFRRKAIEVKYCYHWDGDTIQPYWRYKKGNSPQCYEKAYWMLAYYYIPDSLFPNTYRPDIQNSDFSQQECVYKVEVLRYSEDSLLATIRYNYFGSGRRRVLFFNDNTGQPGQLIFAFLIVYSSCILRCPPYIPQAAYRAT